MQDPFAEVIESSSIKIVAQCWNNDIIPSFGEFIAVRGETRTIYALVHYVHTDFGDMPRRPTPFKKTLAELKREQPQIFEFLASTFMCIPIAYTRKAITIHALPPEPPRIHEFIFPLTITELEILFDKKYFLMHVFGMQQQLSNIDELLLACIRFVHQKKQFPLPYYVDLLDTYALLVNNEYKRVKLFAQRLEKIL